MEGFRSPQSDVEPIRLGNLFVFFFLVFVFWVFVFGFLVQIEIHLNKILVQDL